MKTEELYAFSYNPREDQLTQQEGWDLFGLNNQFLQMGLPTRFWKISRINNEFGEIIRCQSSAVTRNKVVILMSLQISVF